MNRLGKDREPFLFVLDYLLQEPLIYPLSDACPVYFSMGGYERNPPPAERVGEPLFHVRSVPYEAYRKGFVKVMDHLKQGNSYLVNYTQPSHVETNLAPADIFLRSRAPYKLWVPGRFLVFSPECFVRIEAGGSIHSFPMKGTIDVAIPDAQQVLLSDPKETAEHYTIVDLIRNDLSKVARKVRVERLRYVEQVRTQQRTLLQVSSEIRGELGGDFAARLGCIFQALLPAGSVTGAPKDKTVEIIEEAEGYKRGYYTGVMGVFDGCRLDSAVMIRFMEHTPQGWVYKSGGGITAQSDVLREYQELKEKIYVPVF
jgi:para-aminobenzoate synthetase component 1